MIKIIFSILLYGCILGSSSVWAQASDSLDYLKNFSLQNEKDNILALVAADYVFQDWQKEWDSPRGYNIGAVLYDTDADTIIGLHRNSIYEKEDKTQHAEIGLMQGYFHKLYCANPATTLEGLQIITTLEPCMMCAGMMIFLEVDTVKYLQADPEYGKNIEKMAQDWMDEAGIRHFANDRCRRIQSLSLEETCYAAKMLSKGYEIYGKTQTRKGMSEFLRSKVAYLIYSQIDTFIRQWQLVYPENARLLKNARKILHIADKDREVDFSPTGAEAAKANYRTFLEFFNSIR